MMIIVYLTAFAGLMGVVGGCAESTRAKIAVQHGGPPEAHSANAVSSADAARAIGAIERKRRTGDRRPVTPSSRIGNRVIDQPRVGPP